MGYHSIYADRCIRGGFLVRRTRGESVDHLFEALRHGISSKDKDKKSKEAADICSPPDPRPLSENKNIYIENIYHAVSQGFWQFLHPFAFRVSAMFTRTTFVILLLALWSGLAIAQTGSQNASIPNCIRACDTQAIEASNCASEDQYCHCIRYTTILDNIVPCVQHNSTCVNKTADLLSTCYQASILLPLTETAFESLFDDVCSKFNLSVPTNVTGNTTLPSPSLTPTPYTSRASADSAWPLGATVSPLLLVLTALYFCTVL